MGGIPEVCLLRLALAGKNLPLTPYLDGYPPFPTETLAPRAIHYNLKEPKDLHKYYSHPEKWFSDLRAMAQNIPVFGNQTQAAEDRMQQLIANKRGRCHFSLRANAFAEHIR